MSDQLNYKDLTMVFRNVDADRVQKLMDANPDWNALARYDVIEVNQELEEFIRQLSYGNIDDPETAADDLMTKMKWA